MSFSSRRRNYFLTPHRRDGLIEWMKNMLMHSFVLDALATTGGDTFSHFEELVDEHRAIMMCAAAAIADSAAGATGTADIRQSRLKRLVPTVGVFHTPLPLRKAYEAYNAKYKLDKRRHLAISFNEIRHIMNLAQIMALRKVIAVAEKNCDNVVNKRWASSTSNPLHSPSLVALKGISLSGTAKNNIPEFSLDGGIPAGAVTTTSTTPTTTKDEPLPPTMTASFNGPSMITFDGDQTLYSDGANFESNPKLATYLYLLLRNGVTVAVVTAAGYEYQTTKYELRLSGLLEFFQQRQPLLTEEQLNRFYLFGGECNYLLRLGNDYKLHPVKEYGAGGWMTSTKYLGLDSPANWPEQDITKLLDLAESSLKASIDDQNLKLRARFLRKKRSVGLVPAGGEAQPIPREALDETVLRVQDDLDKMMRQQRSSSSPSLSLPYCAFNGGRDVWVDVGNKRVGVQILQSYLGVPAEETLHIGDQFLNTGNDYAARQTCPCVWITSPDETTYILKSILRLAGIVPSTMQVVVQQHHQGIGEDEGNHNRTESDGVFSDSFIGLSLSAAVDSSSNNKKGSNVDFAELERRTSAVATMDVYTGEIITTNPTTLLIPPPTPAHTATGSASDAM